MTDLVPPTHNDPARKKIIVLYGAFGATLLFSIIPTLPAAATSMILLMGVLIAAYVFRGKQPEGSLGENHATYIIRTIWIGSLLAVLTLIIGSIYMLMTINNAPLMACAEAAVNSGIGPDSDIAVVSKIMRPCIDDFISLNLFHLIISCIIVIAPILLYFAVRFLRGLRRAIEGYRVR